MYIPYKDRVVESENHNFLGLENIFGSEQSFGDRVAKDLEALKKADTKKTMSTGTKVAVGIGLLAIVGFIGFKLVKKIKK